MKIIKTFLILSLLVACSTTSTPNRIPAGSGAQQTQITAWNFDWDDNIMYMPTPIKLFQKGKPPGQGLTKIVSTEAFTEIKNVVGPAPLKIAETEVPKDLKPYLNFDAVEESYFFFRDQPGKNHFKADIIRAIEMGHRPPGVKKTDTFDWKGPSFVAFQTALSDLESSKWTSIITARGHAPQSLADGLKYLKTKKYIQLLPPTENVYAVTHPDVLKKFAQLQGVSTASPSEIKAYVMMDFLDKIATYPVNKDMVPVMDQDGTDTDFLHLWGFSDDDYGNYEKAYKVLSSAIKADKKRWQNIKITLFYTGKMKPGVKAFAKVIKSDGSLREQSPLEVAEVQTILKLRKSH